MTAKMPRGLLLAVLISFVVFGLAHDLEPDSHTSAGPETTSEQTAAVPHSGAICALTLIAAGALGAKRARSRLGSCRRYGVPPPVMAVSMASRTPDGWPHSRFLFDFPLLA